MTSRYLGAAGLFLAVLCLVALLLGAVLPVVSGWHLVAIALVLYPLAVSFDLVPPGRPNGARLAETQDAAVLSDARTAPPLVPGPPSPAFAEWSYVGMEGHPPRRGVLAVVVLGTLALGLAAGAFTTRLAMSGGETEASAPDIPPSPPTAPAAVETPSPTAPSTATPTASPTPSPTATPTPEATPTPTATPTEPPPTRVQTDTPPARSQAPAATATPSVAPPPAPAASGSLTGTWEIVDTVTYGPGRGEVTTFEVELSQAGGYVSGAGSGLQLEGERQGGRVLIAFQRTGATGFFVWDVVDGRTLRGSFRDNGVENGGTSVATRVD